MAGCKFFFKLPFFLLSASLSAVLCDQLSDHPDFSGEIIEERTADAFSLSSSAESSLNNRKTSDLRTKSAADQDRSSLVAVQIERKSTPRPSHIPKEVWHRIEPFLLPEDHPAKPALDQLFSATRATLSINSMKKAGFQNPTPRKWTHLVVTKHPKVPGIVFKLYLDAQRYFKGKKEYEHWLERIQGVNLINAEVMKRGWDGIFKTPAKWIYILPKEPPPSKEFRRKACILVEEDMDIYEGKENDALWKSDWVTKELLISFYTLLEELGLHDCAKPDNAPFSKDGRIAFIDTQMYFHWPVLYKKLTPYLSKEMRQYWKTLIKGSKKKSYNVHVGQGILLPYLNIYTETHSKFGILALRKPRD